MTRLGTYLRALALVAAALCAAAPLRAEPAVIFAAASLAGALDDAVAQSGADAVISYGGSGALAQQIARGAPADLVILASPDWMDWLRAGGHVTVSTDLLGGRLVLIGTGAPLPDPDAAALLARLGGGRLAIGQRDAVPAGSYARAWLQSLGAWEALRPHLAEAPNVRGALTFVATGAAPLGVVYATDAAADPRVQVLYDIPADAHPPIRYPAAALSPAGTALLEALRGAPAFAAAGFEVLE
ncbi:MAG: molybdate ABC transporter substrate-binding protein [Pseudomonadota bacterium]